jgi:predicted phage terminase large subunit-like protein
LSSSEIVFETIPGAQKDFVKSPVFEVLYGGRAGGGKTIGLAIAALAGIGDKTYSAVMFRRTYPQLTGRGGLINVSRELYSQIPGANWNDQHKTWSFPSGAEIKFSHMQNRNDHYDHQGKEYHFVGFDELTHFDEDQYLYLFSRIRKRQTSTTPTRMVAASNPGARWVFDRWRAWLDPDHPKHARPGEVRWFRRVGDTETECKRTDDGAWSRTFIPSSYKDNPYLDAEYERNLDLLPYVERQRLKYGDWKAQEGKGTIINRTWVKHTSEPIPQGAQYYRYWDFAASEKKSKSHNPDYTATAFLCVAGDRFLVQVQRRQASWETIQRWVAACIANEPYAVHGGEEEGGASGKVLASELSKIALQNRAGWHSVRPSGDKVTRALQWSPLAERGQVYLLDGGEDRDTVLSELHAFPESDHDDMVDAISGAFELWRRSQPVKAVGRYR